MLRTSSGHKEVSRLRNIMAQSFFHSTSEAKAEFRDLLQKAQHVVVLTGAGASAESGVPTFRGAGGLWRTFRAQELATPHAFNRNPSLVWEFYSYRREVMLTKEPNKAHYAIAEFQMRLDKEGRTVAVVTQNIDELHQRAGTKDVIELHGTLFKTRCTKCHRVEENRNSPIVPALLGKGAPDPDAQDAKIPEKDLPRCSQPCCGALVRPHVVWFGESLDSEVLRRTKAALEECDMCLLIGTSSVVYPAAAFAPMLAARGVPVAEFNLEETPCTEEFRFHFQGPAGETLPPLLTEKSDK